MLWVQLKKKKKKKEKDKNQVNTAQTGTSGYNELARMGFTLMPETNISETHECWASGNIASQALREGKCMRLDLQLPRLLF